MIADRLLVIDIGKTNLKITLLGSDGEVLAEARQPNVSIDALPYLHFDIEGIWRWLLQSIAALPERARIGSIITTTHGAGIALVDDNALLLPVMDYEFSGMSDVDAAYALARDDFATTLSPALCRGLNCGRQLLWLETRFPAEFARAKYVLTYAQYWAWRLCGVAALEVTSLGCHSDLWNPTSGAYAPLVQRRGWTRLMPPIRPASDVLGNLLPELATRTGLLPETRVLCGIHDNNASMVKHLYGGSKATLINIVSTGTWIIVAGFGASMSVLDESRDMQANVDAWGRPFACARFMGGCEFACLNDGGAASCAWSDVSALLAGVTLAIPCFAEMGGPFRGRPGEIRGPAPTTPQSAFALATLYCALVTAECLGSLQEHGDIVIEGPFAANLHYAALLGALRPRQDVYVSDDRSGTTVGTYLLACKPAESVAKRAYVAPCALPGLAAYRDEWLAALSAEATHAAAR